MSKRSLGTTLIGLMVLALGLAGTRAFADSHVRIVRLSYVEGAVKIDRNTGQGFEKAILNMPLTEGMKVATRDGRVEIEFEDGSTVRLTPNSELAFTDLQLRESGARVSTLTLEQGQAYVNFTGKQKDEFTVAFAGERVTLAEAAHFRVDVEDATAQLAVFKGDVRVEGASGAVELAKNKTAIFQLADENRYEIAKNVEEDPFDAWDKQQSKYHQQYASAGSYHDYPYAYGVSDLNYYGNYYNVPGYGTMWQPYFSGAGWSPFTDGSWVFYPGFGYTFVSAYPWGWMPYRYGSWAFVPGWGWMWQPGGWYPGGSYGWYTVPPVRNPPNRFANPTPPSSGTGVVVVGRGPSSPTAPPRRVVVQSGSAGWGVPRGTVSNLGKVSNEAQQNGSATVHATPPSRVGVTGSTGTYRLSPSSSGSVNHGGGSVHTMGGSGTAHSGSAGGHASAPPHR